MGEANTNRRFILCGATQIYLHADLTIKERALARTTPPGTRPGRYHPPDTTLAFLERL
jgi:integrase/recombinase XerD